MSIGIQEREGQYMHAPGFKMERAIKGKTLILLIAGAYNAGGMIAPEMNGIAVINKSDLCVVLDEHLKGPSGGNFWPSNAQIDEYQRLQGLSDDQFIQFCLGNRRFRQGSLPLIEPKKARDRRTLKQLADAGLSYSQENKAAFKAEGARLLRKLAKDLGLEKGRFEISFNAGGIAVSGDHSLHTPDFYLSFNGDWELMGYIRHCDGLEGDGWRRDYGGANIRFDAKQLNSDMPAVVARIRREFLKATA